MDPKKIERINELARKKKEAELTEAELAEQAELRREYLDGYRRNLKAMLDSIVVEEKDGTRHPLQKKASRRLNNTWSEPESQLAKESG